MVVFKKSDFDHVVNINCCFITVESNQRASSSEIAKLIEELKNKERKVDDIENGDKGVNKLWSNLTEINRKVSSIYQIRSEASITN